MREPSGSPGSDLSAATEGGPERSLHPLGLWDLLQPWGAQVLSSLEFKF